MENEALNLDQNAIKINFERVRTRRQREVCCCMWEGINQKLWLSAFARHTSVKNMFSASITALDVDMGRVRLLPASLFKLILFPFPTIDRSFVVIDSNDLHKREPSRADSVASAQTESNWTLLLSARLHFHSQTHGAKWKREREKVSQIQIVWILIYSNRGYNFPHGRKPSTHRLTVDCFLSFVYSSWSLRVAWMWWQMPTTWRYFPWNHLLFLLHKNKNFRSSHHFRGSAEREARQSMLFNTRSYFNERRECFKIIFCFVFLLQPQLSTVSNLHSFLHLLHQKPPTKQSFMWSLNTERLHLCVTRILISMFIAPTRHRSMTLRLLFRHCNAQSWVKSEATENEFLSFIRLSDLITHCRLQFPLETLVFQFHTIRLNLFSKLALKPFFAEQVVVSIWHNFLQGKDLCFLLVFTPKHSFISAFVLGEINFLNFFGHKPTQPVMFSGNILKLNREDVRNTSEKCSKCQQQGKLSTFFFAANGAISRLCWSSRGEKSFQLLQPDVLFHDAINPPTWFSTKCDQ